MPRAKKDELVAVQYVGSGVGVVRRELDGHVWDADNGYVCAVPGDVAQGLVALRSKEFVIAEQAPELPATEEKDGE